MRQELFLPIYGMLLLTSVGCVSRSRLELRLAEAQNERLAAEAELTLRICEFEDYIARVQEGLLARITGESRARASEAKETLQRIRSAERAMFAKLADETSALVREDNRLQNAVAHVHRELVTRLDEESLIRRDSDAVLQEDVIRIDRELLAKIDDETLNKLREDLAHASRGLALRLNHESITRAGSDATLQDDVARIECELVDEIVDEYLAREAEDKRFEESLADIKHELDSKIADESLTRAAEDVRFRELLNGHSTSLVTRLARLQDELNRLSADPGQRSQALVERPASLGPTPSAPGDVGHFTGASEVDRDQSNLTDAP